MKENEQRLSEIVNWRHLNFLSIFQSFFMEERDLFSGEQWISKSEGKFLAPNSSVCVKIFDMVLFLNLCLCGFGLRLI